jgi:hypothetical protein
MPDMIRDGTGSGKHAKVDEDNRLHTRAVTESEEFHVNEEGDAYNINTGIITLTNDAETPILYVKNNHDKDLIISAIAVGFGATDGASVNPATVTVIRNPTAGTIVSGASAVAINGNRNYGSPSTLTVDAFKGATGSTMTDGSDHIILFQGLSGRLFAEINEVIPRGTSIGIKIDPQTTSNTSLRVYAALVCFLRDLEDE